jgi:uncharacterized repeat protein (TIGR02543 family)
MAAKVFEVGVVLPATTQLRISWIGDITLIPPSRAIQTDNGSYGFIFRDPLYLSILTNLEPYDIATIFYNDSFNPPYTNYDGDHAYCDIDTSTWDENSRTITLVSAGMGIFIWEDLAPVPSGYTISFNSNGGTTISDIEEATELPTPLPTPTKSGYTFVAWYYESNFQTRAKAGDTIEANTTLYAKWHNLGSLFTEIADAIREKESSSGTIRDVDFGERVKQIQPAKEEETKTVTPNFSSGNVVVTPTSGKVMSQVTINKDSNLIADNIKKDITVHGITGTLQQAKEEETKTVTPNFSSGNVVVTPTSGKVLSQVTINKDTNHIASNIAKDKTIYGITGTSYIAIELTQAQYDALSTKDSNTYYLIVEE